MREVYVKFDLRGNFKWSLFKREQEGHIKGDKILKWPPFPLLKLRIFRVIIPFGRSDYNLDSFHSNNNKNKKEIHQRWTRRVKAAAAAVALIEFQHFLSPPEKPKFDLY